MKTIVGIDPGVKTGLAIISLDGDVMFIDSRRNFSKSEIVDTISMYGEPVVVATDVIRSPGMIKKMSASFSARIFSPSRRLKKIEKERMAGRLKLRCNDHHERDAVLAAVLAKRRFQTLFSKIDKILEKKGLSHLSDDVKGMMVKRKAVNAEQAVLKICNK